MSLFGPSRDTIVHAWQSAAPALDAMGLRRIDAELYTGARLYLSFMLSVNGVRGWIKASTTGNGMLDAYPQQRISLHPGKTGHGELGAWIVAAATPDFASLPKHAVLDVTCPEIAGAEYEIAITSPIETPEHAPAIARVLLALDTAVHQPANVAAAHVSPVVAAWLAAAPALESLGMRRIESELFERDWIFLRFDVAAGGVLAWIDNRTSAQLDGFAGQRAELRPGGRIDSELARCIAATAGPALAALPKHARIDVTAPEIPGAQYKVQLTSPVAAPEHAVAAAQLLLALAAGLR